MRQLENNLVVFYTGITRSASALLKTQQNAVASQKAKQKTMIKMVGLARQLKAELQKNNLAAFGEIIHENWLLKRSLTSEVSNDAIDGWYARARKAGAVGGKLLGAGAGGFLMFYAPQEKHEAIRRELKELRPDQIRFRAAGQQNYFRPRLNAIVRVADQGCQRARQKTVALDVIGLVMLSIPPESRFVEMEFQTSRFEDC